MYLKFLLIQHFQGENFWNCKKLKDQNLKIHTLVIIPSGKLAIPVKTTETISYQSRIIWFWNTISLQTWVLKEVLYLPQQFQPLETQAF